MVSAVENMAANTSWSALGKATDLRNRILFTLGLLIVYRLGTFIPYEYLCPRDHALHLGLDHRSADDLYGSSP